MLAAGEIRDLLAALLAGAIGGGAHRWREKIGELVVFPLATHPTCNWTVRPTGNAQESQAIAAAVELVREQHPHAG